jgi:hypothetical protein
MRYTIASVLSLLLCATASADPATESADKRVGIGLGVGVATGPNLQVLTSSASHFDVGLGLYYDDWLRVQADHAWRFANLATGASVSVPLYLGLGGFLTDRSGMSDGGLRIPVGIQADFARAPVQVFGEVSPELILVADNRADLPPDPLVLTGLMGVRAAF